MAPATLTMYAQVPARASVHFDLALPVGDESLIARGLAALNANREAFDDTVYQNARMQFLEIARPLLLGNLAYNDFVRIFFREVIEKFGDGVKPYAIRFTKECEAEFSQRERNQQHRRKPSNIVNSTERARQDERYRRARAVFDHETAFGNWQLSNPAIAAALATFRQLADEHYEQAYYPLSVLVRAGRRGEADASQAKQLARLAFEWSLSQQDEESIERWCDLGDMYKNGHGVEPDPATAEIWYRKAAEKGDPRGQWALGLCMYDSDGDAARNEEALGWMSKAAERGEPFLQCWLGDVYRLAGRHEDALQWYGAAASQEDKEGLFKLGTMYEEGLGVPRDLEAAAFWYRKAAGRGHAEAQWQLGQLHEHDGY
jgi:TPR repeat protein